MGLYSLLLSLFAIGAVGTVKANRKSVGVAEKSKRWVKFSTYFALVFAQLFLISHGNYKWFAATVAAMGSFELIAVAKSRKTLMAALLVFGLSAFGFWCFYLSAPTQQQQFVFVCVIIFDGFSQISGQLFGKRKLFPTVSPGKTVEGLAGGFAGLMVCALVVSDFLAIGFSEALADAALVALFSVSGDLLASYYKRLNSVKDFSQLIPGHGGVLDRYDSLIFASAAMFVFANVDVDGESASVACFAGLFGIVFAMAEVGYRVFRLKCELTRKFVHVSSGLVCLGFPLFLESWISVLVLCAGFVALLSVSQKTGLLPSINAIGRKSFGSVSFPVSVFGCFCTFLYTDSQLYFYLPISILAVCDPLAAFSGKMWPFGKYKIGDSHKTLMGSAAFLVSCFAVSVAGFYFCGIWLSFGNIGFCVALSLVVALSEAFSRNGLDNLAIPATAIGFLYFTGF